MQKQNRSILLVDDDEDDVFFISKMLKTVGSNYDVIHASNGKDALQKLYELKEAGDLPCLIIMDINMPKMDGKQTLVAIQRDGALSSVPIVIYTTSSSEIDKRFFMEKRVEMITKPVDVSTFHVVAQKILSYCKTEIET